LLGPKGGQFIVINKMDLIRGITPPPSQIFVSRLIPSFFAIQPAEFVNSNESSATFMVTLGQQGLFGGKSVTTFIVNGTLPNIEVKILLLKSNRSKHQTLQSNRAHYLPL
jgi:hypothetical protein